VLLECGDVAENRALVLFEEGTAPPDGFDDTGTGLVNQFADMRENRLRKGFDLAMYASTRGSKQVGWAHGSLLGFAQQCIGVGNLSSPHSCG
jgi:hypothetical protein